MSKKTKLDEDEYTYEDWSDDFDDRDRKRYNRRKQEIVAARRVKSREKDSFFSEND